MTTSELKRSRIEKNYQIKITLVCVQFIYCCKMFVMIQELLVQLHFVVKFAANKDCAAQNEIVLQLALLFLHTRVFESHPWNVQRVVHQTNVTVGMQKTLAVHQIHFDPSLSPFQAFSNRLQHCFWMLLFVTQLL